MIEVFKQLQELGLFNWLDEEHNLADNRDITPEYLDNLSINDIHRTVMNACAFRWFREKHGWYVDLFVDDDKTFGFMITYFIDECRVDKPIKRGFNTYTEAELASIDILIEIVKSSAHGK